MRIIIDNRSSPALRSSALLLILLLVVVAPVDSAAQAAASPRPAGGGSSGAAVAPGSDAVLLAREVVRMGTRLGGRVWAADRQSAAWALEAAFRAVRDEEELLSTWRGETELARVNRSRPGRTVTVDERLHGLLREAWRISEATGGAFDPVVGALVDAWDLRGEGRRPTAPGLRAAREASGRRCFRIGDRRRVERRCPGAWVDAGAFGKGSGLRRARTALEEAGVEAALLDFGGQLMAMGSPPDRSAWPTAVAHPADRGRTVARLGLRDRSAATTASSERFVMIDGEPRGHVLDSRSGRPVPPWGSVTVVADDPMLADALSTALFVMGPAEALAWAGGREDVGVLALELEEDGGVAACWNGAMEPYLEERPERRACPGEPDEDSTDDEPGEPGEQGRKRSG